MPDDELPIARWVHAEPEIDAIQVTAEHARAIAQWCGGWACDDLRWNDRMGCYHRPGDDPDYPGAMFQSLDEQTPGGVMLPYGFPAPVGNWVTIVRGHAVQYSDEQFRARFRPVNADG